MKLIAAAVITDVHTLDPTYMTWREREREKKQVREKERVRERFSRHLIKPNEVPSCASKSTNNEAAFERSDYNDGKR